MNKRLSTQQDVELGRKIRLRRIELKMSQDALGGELGISFQQVQKYEKGTNRVTVARLERIAAVLQMPISHFYTADDQTNVSEINRLMSTDSAFTVRLLRAFIAIPDQEVRRQLATVMETIGAAMNAASTSKGQ